MGEKYFSIRLKMYIFVVITVLAVAAGTSFIAFTTSANEIDNYYKQNASDNARNFATMVDGDFLAELRVLIESDEYQQLREKAEAEENEELIENYLKEKGVWEKYYDIRTRITNYVNNMEGVKYLYIVAPGDINADHDMYLIDDESTELYETGYYEEREEELLGIDITQLPEPTISHGDWGWLCSDFKPVYTSDGKCVSIVGCDFGMDEVMKKRRELLIYLIAGSLIFTVIVLAGAMKFINKIVVNPLNTMTKEMKRFNPSEKLNYEDAGVIDLDIKSNDEISEIYKGIRNMQINIIDYLKDMTSLQKDKMRAENDIRDKEKKIGELSKETYKDALTGVGNKAAFLKKTEEINRLIKEKNYEYAIVMVDMNNLKEINDIHGHKAGDMYIRGCCHMLCEAFKHSPVFRIGGDEFVAVLHAADYDDRKNIVEKLKADFEETYNKTDVDPWCKYSAAVGLAENAFGDYTMDLVFKRADKAMYEDKAKFKEKYGGSTR